MFGAVVDIGQSRLGQFETHETFCHRRDETREREMMPIVTRWFIKSGLACFVAALLLGVASGRTGRRLSVAW
jgi:hypothetical protein